jgi:hypothetical protein
MSPTLAVAIGLVRGWTRLYSRGMEPAVRVDRCAEIDSDLWEFHEDARRRGATPTLLALHIVLRLVLGIRHDLLWRAEHVRVRSPLMQQALWVTAAASVVFVWWLASTLQAVEAPRMAGINVMRLLYPIQPLASVPTPPRPPIEFVRARFVVRPPPPPPPPPPYPPWR